MTNEQIANRAVDNAETAAQLEIKDAELRDSLVRNFVHELERFSAPQPRSVAQRPVDCDQIALDAAHQIECLPSAAEGQEARKTALIHLIVLDAIRCAAQGKPDCGAWMPIETAPRDGTPVLLGFPGHFHAMHGHCEDGFWGQLDSDFGFEHMPTQPTHWMHLPAPPSSITSTQDKSP